MPYQFKCYNCVMKKLVLCAFLILNAAVLFAQAIPPSITTTAPITTVMPNTTRSAPSKSSGSHKSALPSTDNITDNIAKMETLSKFFHALELAGLTETFKSKGPITIFVPDDQAFDKMKPGKLDTLLKPAHQPELIAFITYHAIAGAITSKNLARQIKARKNAATFTTLAGSKLTAKIDAGRNIILTDETGGESTISKFDMAQSNGMLFIINNVLVPKPKLL